MLFDNILNIQNILKEYYEIFIKMLNNVMTLTLRKAILSNIQGA